jgi:hypothetical protein
MTFFNVDYNEPNPQVLGNGTTIHAVPPITASAVGFVTNSLSPLYRMALELEKPMIPEVREFFAAARSNNWSKSRTKPLHTRQTRLGGTNSTRVSRGTNRELALLVSGEHPFFDAFKTMLNYMETTSTPFKPSETLPGTAPFFERTLRMNQMVTSIVHDAMAEGWAAKGDYMIPRPHALTKAIQGGSASPELIAAVRQDSTAMEFYTKYGTFELIPVYPAPSHPSYPSGHAIYGAVLAEVTKHYFNASPGTIKEIDEIGKAIGRGRCYAGIHYLEDFTAGHDLGVRHAGLALS